MTRFKGISLFVIFIILVSSCRKDEIGELPTEAASLTISVGLPSITLDTRAREMYSSDDESNYGKIVSDPFATDLTGWSDYEKLIDGREIYRLTLLLVDKVDGVLVGYRDLYKGSDDMRSANAKEGANGWIDGAEVVTDAEFGTQVKVTFNYDNPLHQLSDGSSLECLERGLYRMIVVANWSELTMKVTDKKGNDIVRTYPGLKYKDVLFETYVKSVLAQYNGQSGSSPLKFSGSDSKYTDYHNLMDFAIHSSDSDFLCAIGPQPLTLIQDFELQPGMNNISGQLKRTWARLRVAVENISHEELTIHDIRFGDNTTRNYSFLFVNPADEIGSFTHPNTDTKHGAPNIFNVSDNEPDGQYTNPYNALVSTKKETTIKGLESESGNTKIIFDGYILDSDSHGPPFTYDLDIEYVGKSVKKLKRAKNVAGNDWDVNKSSPDDVEDGGLYVIQNQTSSKRVLYAGNGQLETVLLANDGHGNLKDQDYYFEPAQVFRFIRAKDGNGNAMSETVTNIHGGNPGKEESYPVFHIQTYDELYFLGTPQEDFATNLPLDSNVNGQDLSGYNSFVVRNDGFRDGPTDDPDKYKDERYLCFYSTKPNSQNRRDFINVNGSSTHQDQVNGWSDNDAGSEFYIHKVAEVTEGAHYVGTVTLSTIDPDTSVSTPVSKIYRNDFINILIVASFNEKTGELDFKVKDWNKGGGNIEFN